MFGASSSRLPDRILPVGSSMTMRPVSVFTSMFLPASKVRLSVEAASRHPTLPTILIEPVGLSTMMSLIPPPAVRLPSIPTSPMMMSGDGPSFDDSAKNVICFA
jgi:hypothetical protein